MSNPPESVIKKGSTKHRLIKFLVMLLLLALIAFVIYYLFLGGKERLAAQKAETAAVTATTADRPSGAPSGPGGAPGHGAMAGAGAGRPAGGMMGMSTKVSVVKAQKRPMNFVIRGLGTAIPSETVVVRSQVSGPLIKIFFDEGAMVDAGEPLFQIDPRPFEAKLQHARGQYQQNEAQLANAEADLRRYQTLFKQNSIARQQVDTQNALVKQQRANRAALQAQVEQAKIELEYTTIKAPISGRVGLRRVDIGNLVQANATDGLVTITQNQPMDVEFAVSEQYIPQIAAKFYQNVPIEVQLYDRSSSDLIERGAVSSMANQIDTATGTVKIKASFDNSDYGLFPNQFVNAWLFVERYDNSLSILTDAIQYGRQGPYVFLVNDDMSVKQQDIKVGIVDNGYTQVLEGLNDGDQVVIEGVDRLRAGSKVEIVD